MALFGNPFSSTQGAINTGPAGNANTNVQRSPNSGPNNGNTNSGIDPSNNTGNNEINPNPNDKNSSANNNANGNDPMADLSKLWENPPEDPNNPKKDPTKYVPDIDPKALSETVGKMDFTKAITPEQRAAMLAGGEQGLAAMMELINSVGRQAVATTYQAGQKLMSSALENARTDFMNQVPNHVRNANTSAALSKNPLVNNPAYKPLVDNVTNQFLEKYPKATPDQVAKAVDGYFDQMVKDMQAPANKANEQDNTQKLRSGMGDADWIEWAADELGLK